MARRPASARGLDCFADHRSAARPRSPNQVHPSPLPWLICRIIFAIQTFMTLIRLPSVVMTDQLIATCAGSGTPPTAFVTKIAVVISDDLPVWQKLNMTAFLASGVAASAPDAVGADYADADGTRYSPMFGQPVMVFAADAGRLACTLDRALSRGVVPTVFTTDLFCTGNDAANRAAVAAVPRERLDLAGIAIRGDRKTVDKITAG